MEVHIVAVSAVQSRNNEWLVVPDEANVAEKARIENSVDCLSVVVPSIRDSSDAVAICSFNGT
jgi:hypothetical protein